MTLTGLPANWDSHGARPINGVNVTEALKLLRKVMLRRTPLPSLVPTPDGSLQLEWHENGVDLEIRIASDGAHHVSVEDEHSVDWEGPVTANMSRLMKVIRQISE
jgi:hypothetical protein